MPYKHLSLEEIHYLELELEAGASRNKIAKKLNRHKSTLGEELAIPANAIAVYKKRVMTKLKDELSHLKHELG